MTKSLTFPRSQFHSTLFSKNPKILTKQSLNSQSMESIEDENTKNC